MSERVAVVLFNLGGPDRPDAVKPFLFNLFNDPAILRLPGLARWLLARFISSRRAKTAREIYAKIGGKSPILPQTQDQASALETSLGDARFKTFVCMRYWHPLSEEVVAEVCEFAPDKVVLLPLYPQFSSSTTASSFADWEEEAKRQGLKVPTVRVCCYPMAPGFIAAVAGSIQAALDRQPLDRRPRILFSAHGLPKKFVLAGDPYQDHIEKTVAAVIDELGESDLDCVTCYQSKVGRLEWLSPSTEDEIRRAGQEGLSVIVVPIAFVSEHSETLVELDMEYRDLAEEVGVPGYDRVATSGVTPAFIDGLADIAKSAAAHDNGIFPPDRKRLCPQAFSDCPCSRTTVWKAA